MKYSLLLLLVCTLACPVGTSVRHFEPAGSAHGVQADLRLGKHWTRLQGELLEVRDSTLVLLRNSEKVTVVPIRLIRSARFAKVDIQMESNRLSQERRDQLRLFSRFPGGLTPELEARVLALYGQTEPDQVVVP